MTILRLVKKWVNNTLRWAKNLLVPESGQIQKLLDIPAGDLYALLPKSAVYSKDVYVLFDYQNKIVRLIVKSIKYKNNASLRRRVAGYLYEELVDLVSEITLFDGQSPLLLPMPMSKMEKKNRGFNQCEELVNEIKKLSGNLQAGGIEVSYNTLKKVRETERQTRLSREERSRNVESSMEASKSVNGKCVIILDDVFTTGASFGEARRALLSIGARRVIGLFIAH